MPVLTQQSSSISGEFIKWQSNDDFKNSSDKNVN
jgi:hypothetical protein